MTNWSTFWGTEWTSGGTTKVLLLVLTPLLASLPLFYRSSHRMQSSLSRLCLYKTMPFTPTTRTDTNPQLNCKITLLNRSFKQARRITTTFTTGTRRSTTCWPAPRPASAFCPSAAPTHPACSAWKPWCGRVHVRVTRIFENWLNVIWPRRRRHAQQPAHILCFVSGLHWRGIHTLLLHWILNIR